MKIILTENQYSFLTEALKPSEFRKFMSIGRELALTRIGEIWSKLEAQCDSKNRNGDRLYFKIKQDLDDKSFDLPIRKQLEDYLDSNNLNVINFKNGMVQKKSGGNIFSLGKALTILSKKDNTALDLLRQYNNQKSNVALTEDLIMVISKSPYDLAGMSTDRAWKSCMNLRGDNENMEYIEIDVSNGTLISYLIEAKDLNIQNPIGRILIKPYLKNNNEKDILYGIEKDSVKHGRNNVDYVKSLIHVLDVSQNEKTGIFKLDSGLYPDGFESITKLDSKKDYDIKDLCEIYDIKNYTINPDGLVDVDGDVNLREFQLKKLPFNFGKVTGDFYCFYNNLTSLQGAPTSVGGEFNCSKQKNGKKFTQQDVIDVCKVKGAIYV